MPTNAQQARRLQAVMPRETRQAAKRLAEFHLKVDPNIIEILLFPKSDEIRFVEVVDPCLPSGEMIVSPTYFPPFPQDQINYSSGVAVIPPAEKDKAELPETWGAWNDAVVFWKKKKGFLRMPVKQI
ncbi:MAG: hypothetical protein NTX50_10320 [Candidatus Sumerlaeota bacterium]|nr:hypothetical protein [Candidatus Sumerlaeota bacterium]